jgi:SAM-dependent methyltransferase
MTDFDWAGHWRALVDAREREVPVDPGQDYWSAPSRSLLYDPAAARDDPLLKAMDPYLEPRKTAIDAGAGAGRHAIPLAERLDWVTAVEPSEGMRRRMPHRDNLTVIGSSWEDAEVEPADLVVSAHVLYFVREPAPFIRKLEEAAQERVFVLLRDHPLVTPSEPLYEVLSGRPRTRLPQLYDLWNLLHSLGRRADVTLFKYRSEQLYSDLEEAVAECRSRLGPVWREAEGIAWLERNLDRRPDGMLVYGGESVAGVAQWQPRQS